MACAETITSRGDPSIPGTAPVDIPPRRRRGSNQVPTATTVLPGRQLRPGDVIVGGYGDAHRIDHLARYPTRFSGADGAGARIAYDADGSWRRTIADNHPFHRLAWPKESPITVRGGTLTASAADRRGAGACEDPA